MMDFNKMIGDKNRYTNRVFINVLGKDDSSKNNKIKMCQICNQNVATIDGKTTRGPWAYMCDECHADVGVGFGVGKGQYLKREPISMR